MNTMTMPRTTEVHSAQRWSVGRWAARIGRFLAYGLLVLLLGIIGFSLVQSFLVAGVGTIIVWVGLPVLVLGVVLARGFAMAERSVRSSILGTDLPTPAAKQPPVGAGPMRRLVTPLTDP